MTSETSKKISEYFSWNNTKDYVLIPLLHGAMAAVGFQIVNRIVVSIYPPTPCPCMEESTTESTTE